jgi:hypothetical protein
MVIDYRINYGSDPNYFKSIEVSNTTFGVSTDGYKPDVFIPFVTQGFSIMSGETTGVVEYSFNGITVHGEVDAAGASKALIFDNRVACKIWFRVKTGTNPHTIRFEAWSVR